MRERINRLARGIVDAELPKLFLSPVKVEETLGSDTIYKRELYLSSENNLSIKGLGLLHPFQGEDRLPVLRGLRNHIVYEVDTSWCENGDVIRVSVGNGEGDPKFTIDDLLPTWAWSSPRRP